MLRWGKVLLLSLGLAAIAIGLFGTATATSTSCNGTITYSGGGWSFECNDGECPAPHECANGFVGHSGGYYRMCDCGPLEPICCHLIGDVTVIPGVPNTIQPAKVGDCNPPTTACPAGQCAFVWVFYDDGTSTVTAECK